MTTFCISAEGVRLDFYGIERADPKFSFKHASKVILLVISKKVIVELSVIRFVTTLVPGTLHNIYVERLSPP